MIFYEICIAVIIYKLIKISYLPETRNLPLLTRTDVNKRETNTLNHDVRYTAHLIQTVTNFVFLINGKLYAI